jgi:predicted tellurium resistance membrane protein TerC
MFDIFLISGLVGAILIICAWAFEAFESVEHHKSLIDLKFAVLYLVAMSLLIVHSVSINDAVFVFLNSTVLVIISFEVLYTLHLHRKGVLRKRRLKNKNSK